MTWSWESASHWAPPTGVALVAIVYVAVCTTLRFWQMGAMQKRFGYSSRASFSRMTVDDAYQIQTWLAEQEFPKVFSASVFFALFKTYGIPSISRLLVGTGQFIYRDDGTRASKRAADTSVLLTNMVIGRPGSQRAVEAVARTNYLHSVHRRAGHISDDDMLYTLSLFTLEGMRWTDRYEWRKLTPMERCAMATFWKALGEDLEITYNQLPSCQSGWSDGLHWLKELDTWSNQYEKQCMRPDDFNARLAESTIGLALHKVPNMFKPMGRHLVSLLLEPRFREAMRNLQVHWDRIQHPPLIYQTIFNFAISLRKVLLRYFFLPRPYFLRHVYIEENPHPLTGRYNVSRWRFHPWYAAPSYKGRWGILAWITWAIGKEKDRVGAKKFIPEGYLLTEVGPHEKVGKGKREMQDTAIDLAAKDPHRCPFALE
ncbi:hypothetical protein F5Y19DRAFT_484749 [Xylariaceae sp. FL1651]|nr:hypothetical protein F5Y19DRAFT_484749 [Xylariaceae sp. FL1651]